MLDLRRRWLSPGGSALPWGGDGPGMYTAVAWEALPPLPPCDGSFGWLPPLSPKIKGMANAMWKLEGEANVRAHLAAVDSQARALGCALPAYYGHRDHTNRRIAITRFAAWRSERSDVVS